MENYADMSYPTKAGVYAVRQGPIISQNIISYIQKQQLTKYVPQDGFLSLMITGDGSSIGQKFGISFVGQWVWKMKNAIDMSFMDLFNPNYLYKDYSKSGTKYPIDKYEQFEDKSKFKQDLQDRVNSLNAKQAAEILGCSS